MFSEDFLSSINPFLLQAEIAAALLLGIGIVFESHWYNKGSQSVERIGFWCVVVGVVFETIFSILLFASEGSIANQQRDRIASLGKALKLAELHAADRVITSDDDDKFFDWSFKPGQALYLVYPAGDDEALRFARSIRDEMTGNFRWTGGVIHPVQEGPSISLGVVGPDVPAHPVTGIMCCGAAVVFGQEDNDSDRNTEAAQLYGALISAGFCASPAKLRPGAAIDPSVVDPSPTVVTVIVDHKDRNTLEECK